MTSPTRYYDVTNPATMTSLGELLTQNEDAQEYSEEEKEDDEGSGFTTKDINAPGYWSGFQVSDVIVEGLVTS